MGTTNSRGKKTKKRSIWSKLSTKNPCMQQIIYNIHTNGINVKINMQDTYRIAMNETTNELYEQPVLVGDTSYNEDLFAQDIAEFINEQNRDQPFFIYYSMWTPHSSIVQPPHVRPDGTDMDFSPCYDAFPDRTQPNCSLVNDTRCVFCKQLHYASQNIKEIIDAIKTNNNLNWNETIVIITSDNGATPTSGNGYAFGSTLPYRGVKS